MRGMEVFGASEGLEEMFSLSLSSPRLALCTQTWPVRLHPYLAHWVGHTELLFSLFAGLGSALSPSKVSRLS